MAKLIIIILSNISDSNPLLPAIFSICVIFYLYISHRQHKRACSTWSANDPLVQFQPGEREKLEILLLQALGRLDQESWSCTCSCRLLVSALSSHPAAQPRCSILPLSLTAGGLSIICVTVTQIRIFKELKRGVNQLQEFVRLGVL